MDAIADRYAGVISDFAGPFWFLSNFSPGVVSMYGQEYPTVEHAFQAAKTEGAEEREAIRLAPTPLEAKRMGRKVKLRAGWDTTRLNVMEELLRRKFADENLAALLAGTCPAELVEGNTWGDQFWGQTVPGFVGENHLGKLLMKIRDEMELCA